MRTLVYYSLGSLLVCFLLRYMDDSLEKVTIGTVLLWLLTGLLGGAMVKYLEESHAPALAWLVGMAGVAMLLLMLHRVFILLGIPVR
jgi:heme A synthase